MKANTSSLALLLVGTVLSVTVIARPSWISDSNPFLENFVNHEYLNVLGVILAITLASLAQAHLSLNRMEEQRGYLFLSNTRREIKDAAYWLIALFAAGFIIVLAKPIICNTETAAAIANGLAIFILAFYVLILVDVTMAVFDLKADVHGEPPAKASRSGKTKVEASEARRVGSSDEKNT